jgi:hypothetical protein
LKFVAHHLWNPAKREAQRKHGMPQNVAKSLREDGLLRNEVRTRRRRSGGGCRAGPPCTAGADRGAVGLPCPAAGLPLAVQASVRPRHRKRRRAVTRDVLDQVLATCASEPSGRPPRRRDPDCRVCVGRTAAQRGGGPACRAASRRAVRAPPADEGSMLLACLAIQFGRTKTASR